MILFIYLLVLVLYNEIFAREIAHASAPLAAILRGHPRQIARPRTSPQAFFAKKSTFANVFLLF